MKLNLVFTFLVNESRLRLPLRWFDVVADYYNYNIYNSQRNGYNQIHMANINRILVNIIII